MVQPRAWKLKSDTGDTASLPMESEASVPETFRLESQTPENDYLAAVDLGSNSFHMTVARAPGGRIHVVDRMKEMVRLAAKLDAQNFLKTSAMDAALECLRRFGQRIRQLAPQKVRTVGTNTLRRAKNRDAFLGKAEEALGHRIQIIAGREEARLIYLGVAHSIQPQSEQLLVMDIGGGSTEFVIGRQFTPLATESLYIGCVGFSRLFFPDGRMTHLAFKKAELAALQEIESLRPSFMRMGWDRAVGSSGTIRAVSEVLIASGWSQESITANGISELVSLLIKVKDARQLDLAGLNKERAPVFAGGLSILSAAFKALGISELQYAPGSLKEGLLHDMVGRFAQSDIREETISHLCQRYQVDPEQAERVEGTALYLRKQVEKVWHLKRSQYRRLLSWASKLHELGLSIAHSHYHKHGAYLIEHSDLPGFSTQEQFLLGLLVGAHRRKFNPNRFESLTGKDRQRALSLAVLLRLSFVLNRSRNDTQIPAFRVQVEPDSIHLLFPLEWLERHPLTAADLKQEGRYLKSAGMRLKFE